MSNLRITFENASDLIKYSWDEKEIDQIVDEIGRLTYTKIKDIKNRMFTAIRLEKAGGNTFMIDIMRQSEQRKQELEDDKVLRKVI